MGMRESEMPEDGKSFWTTLPGVLTGLAAVISAATGLFVATRSAEGPTQVSSNLSVPSAATPATDPTYHLIVASSPSKPEAIAQARRLRADGHPSEVILSTTGVYAVTLGHFPGREAAAAALRNARQRGVAPADAYVLPPERWKATEFP